VSSSNVRLRDERFSSKSNSEKDNGLPDGVEHNVFNHLAGDKVIVFVLRLTLEEFSSGLSSSESEGSKRVHDEVNPE